MEPSDEAAGPSAGSSNSAAQPRQRSNKACRTCAEAKLKCVYSSTEEGAKCDRCARLKKTCTTQTPKPRKRRQPDKARVTQLEKRLDTVLKLLSAQDGRQAEGGPSVSGWDEASAAELNMTGRSQRGDTASSIPSQQHTLTDQEVSPPGGAYETPISQGQSSADESMMPETEEDFLRVFRRRLTPAFPFVVVPESYTVEELRSMKPFLFETISVIAANPSPAVQQASGKRLLDHMCQRIFQDGEKSLDVLQGLMLMIGWNNKLYFRKAQMTNLIQLALALIVDLCLNKAPNQYDRQKMATFATDQAHGEVPLPYMRTSDERRTLLGYFYMASVLATSHKRLDLPTYSPHMEECREYLEAEREYSTDARLVQLVKIQNFTQRVTHTLNGDSKGENPGQTIRAISMCIEAFASELADLKENLPPSLQHDSLLLMHYHAAEVHLYEVGLTLPYSMTEYEKNVLSRQQILTRCVEPIQRYLDVFCATPASSFFFQPIVIWIMMASASITLSKLIFFQGADWDVRSVRQQADLPSMLLRFIDRCLQVSDELKHRRMHPGTQYNEVKFWDEHSEKVNWIKAFYEMKLQTGGSDTDDLQMPRPVKQQREETHPEPQPMSTTASPAAAMSMPPMPGFPAGGPPPMAAMQSSMMQFWDEGFFHEMAWDPGLFAQFPTGMDMSM